MSTENFEKALKEIDRFNSQDPRQKIVDGIAHPQELTYSRSLTGWVLKLDPQASEALRIAACGQHIGRWTVPRAEYPADRSGYLKLRFKRGRNSLMRLPKGLCREFLLRLRRVLDSDPGAVFF